MKARCLLGHDWKELPWFYVNPMTTDPFDRLMPNRACLRCGKLKYRNRPVMIVTTVEGRRTPWVKYEGQWIAKGYSSQKEMIDAYRASRDSLLKKVK